MGRELPPAEVLAADQRITAWARELKAAGLEGDMDVLRARAYLDLLLGKDSRPRQDTASAPAAGPAAAAASAGFAGRVTVIVPLTTLQDQADRPGEIPGIGPIDPALARDLARAAAQNPRSTWCVTVTDEQGHAIGHGCARPEPKNHQKRAGPGPPGRHGTGNRNGPGFAFTATSQDGPPGGWPPEAADNQICWSPSTRSPPGIAITASRPGAMIPGSSSGTSLRSGTPPVPPRSVGGPRPSPTSSTTPRMKRAALRLCSSEALLRWPSDWSLVCWLRIRQRYRRPA